jgi:alpha-L-fucosidase 2
MLKSTTTLLTILLLSPLSVGAAADPGTTLRFDAPARTFHESLPLGNGRLGAMDLGGAGRQRIVLNENTMWSGGPYDANRPDAHKCLPEVRDKFFAGDFDGAGKALGNFRYADGVKGWFDHDQFGCYQILADLTVDFGDIEITSPSGHGKGDGKTIDNRNELTVAGSSGDVEPTK